VFGGFHLSIENLRQFSIQLLVKINNENCHEIKLKVLIGGENHPVKFVQVLIWHPILEPNRFSHFQNNLIFMVKIISNPLFVVTKTNLAHHRNE
jgi:hypothetical protein